MAINSASITHSPDASGRGLVDGALDAMRYDNIGDEPDEVGAIIRAMMPSGVRVLDVGCGTGSMTRIANDGKGNAVLGIEPDATRAAAAAARGLSVITGYLDEPFVASGRSFEVVVMTDVIEHVPDPAGMLRLVSRLLSPNGVVIVSVPNVAHWTVRLKLLFGRFDYAESGIMDATHLRWFTARTLRDLFVSCGFEVTEMRQSAGAWLPVYRRAPFSFLPTGARHALVQRLSRILPLLFGAQHTIKAKLAVSGLA